MAEPPADRCPFIRPFPHGFTDCPTYQPSQYVALSTHYEAMEPIWSCNHLEVSELTAGSHRHYARCRLGTEADRAAWVTTMRADRIEALRRTGEELAAIGAGLGAELVAAKGRQLQQRWGSPEFDAATAELQAAAQAWLTAADAFLEEKAGALAVMGITPTATSDLLHELLEGYVDQRTAETPTVTEAMLERFPREQWVLFRPDLEVR